jgi:hypothetical protein
MEIQMDWKAKVPPKVKILPINFCGDAFLRTHHALKKYDVQHTMQSVHRLHITNSSASILSVPDCSNGLELRYEGSGTKYKIGRESTQQVFTEFQTDGQRK